MSSPSSKTSRQASQSLVAVRDEPAATRTLVCFPAAGAGAAAFAPLAQYLPAGVNLQVAVLPGREHRIRERPLTSMHDMVEAMLDPLDNLGGEQILFGHCGGAILAFELAQRMRDSQRARVSRLIVSAQVSPSTPDPAGRNTVHDLPVPQLLEHLQRIDAVKPELMANPELMQFFLPGIRGDLQAIEEYAYQDLPVLQIPIVATGGQYDALIAPAEMATWHHFTSGAFSMHLFAAGHGYLAERPAEVLSALTPHLQQ